MPEIPDFEQIANIIMDRYRLDRAEPAGGARFAGELLGEMGRTSLLADLIEQLRQVWNARGAADAASILDNWDRYENNGPDDIEGWIRKVDR